MRFNFFCTPTSIHHTHAHTHTHTVCAMFSVVGFIFSCCLATTVAAQSGALAGLGVAFISKPILFEVTNVFINFNESSHIWLRRPMNVGSHNSNYRDKPHLLCVTV